MADLLSTPPLPKQEGAVPRDWRTVTAGELVDHQVLRYVELDTPVETACQILIDYGLSSLPIRTAPNDESVCGTFDYTDLNAFLLLIMGLYQPDEDEDLSSFEELAKKARAGGSIPVKLVKDLGKKGPFVTVPESAHLTKVVETLGSGVHRIAVVREGTNKVIGIISQLRLIRFFWEYGRCFSSIEALYPCSLRELNIGSNSVISINGDRIVLDALELMNTEGVSSLAVVDNQHNVIGNISTADVKYLTRSSSIPLLKTTCFHFLTVVLTDRGLTDGKDSYPVFHVNPQSSLAHTVAKIVATQAHRMWIVETSSPASSAPPTPTISPAVPASSTLPPHHPSAFSPPGNTGLLPGMRMGGRLTGVVSLTDILHLIARSAGLAPEDPNEARRQRRRSSSSSMRASFDQGRSSIDLRELREHRGSIEIRR
ncbi:hypothetical protein FN846DRAFT_778260 [Sphaerosporella brunnea]|uniref:Protein SDS23 n=1 Tax=Sphaerosporella brunnea TaxID=1250544 RepID=A0A5J5EXR2_9PEZI|nr:hypothetical protein FN846DRAFT_778260 [Sphaerosporella brunnea]